METDGEQGDGPGATAEAARLDRELTLERGSPTAPLRDPADIRTERAVARALKELHRFEVFATGGVELATAAARNDGALRPRGRCGRPSTASSPRSAPEYRLAHLSRAGLRVRFSTAPLQQIRQSADEHHERATRHAPETLFKTPQRSIRRSANWLMGRAVGPSTLCVRALQGSARDVLIGLSIR